MLKMPRAQKDKKIKIKISDSLRKEIIKKGFDPVYGARPIRRAIQNLVEDNLAEALLDKKIKSNSNATLDYENEKVIITKMKI